ncbi:MAG: hypothetical protein U1E65_00310 [Myxococcota bacterium]
MRAYLTISILAFALAMSSCGGGDGTTCTSSGDCKSGMICVSGKCQANSPVGKSCTKDDQCKTTEFCDVDSRCKPRGGADGGSGNDAGGGSDAEAVDLGSSDDAGTSPDATEPADSGVIDDAGVDAGNPPTDSGQPLADAGVPADAGLPIDSGVPADAGLPIDSGVHPDASVAPDAGSGCSTDPQCAPPSTICIGSQCVPGCVQNPALCQAGEVCNPGTGRCQRCTLDADCLSPDLICINTACTRRCDRPPAPACGTNTVCNPNDGRCIPGNLALGAVCSINAQCTTRTCLGVTIGGVDHTVCSDPCNTASYCPLNFGCVNLSGMSFCLSETLFTPPATFDTRAGGACSTGNITCQSGWCNTQAMSCIETCSREQDCASFGGNCFTYAQTGTPNSYDHLCVSNPGFLAGIACVTNSDCQSGICDRYTGTCAAHCCADADCPGGQNCLIYDLDATSGDIVKVCEPKSAGSGNTALNGTCTMPTDCDSEVCVSTDPANANAPRQCSTLCCRNSDCAGIPNGRCIPAQGPTLGTFQTIVGICAPVP